MSLDAQEATRVMISMPGSGEGSGPGVAMSPGIMGDETEKLLKDNATDADDEKVDEELDEESEEGDEEDVFSVKFLIEPEGPKRPSKPRAKQVEFHFECDSPEDWEKLTPNDMKAVILTVGHSLCFVAQQGNSKGSCVSHSC